MGNIIWVGDMKLHKKLQLKELKGRDILNNKHVGGRILLN